MTVALRADVEFPPLVMHEVMAVGADHDVWLAVAEHDEFGLRQTVLVSFEVNWNHPHSSSCLLCGSTKGRAQ